MPWLFLGKRGELCKDALFVDVDYPQLMRRKVETIDKTEQLRTLLPNLTKSSKPDGVLLNSDVYAAVGCDLRDLGSLLQSLREILNEDNHEVAILYVAEVSVAYMDLESSQAVFEWVATTFEDVRFCLLEQHLPDGPDHPFARTMLKHFEKLRTPLRAIGTMADIRKRFVDAGWPVEGVDVRSLWELWSDDDFLTGEQRRALDDVEPFDEWEEFALFASHYFLLVARKGHTRHAGEQARVKVVGNDGAVGQSLVCDEVVAPHSHRRFCVTVPALEDDSAVAIHGGLGTKERLTTISTYATTGNAAEVQGPPLRSGLMCHTITRLGASRDCLLVGGRTSPDRANAECWLRRRGRWERTQDLSEGRFRHCAISVIDRGGDAGVLIFGGKTSDGSLLNDFMLWTEERGWEKLTPSCRLPKGRFGASMVADSTVGDSGMLLGGMKKDGTMHEEIWRWKWDQQKEIVFENVTDEVKRRFKSDAGCLWRFGAQVAHWEVDGDSTDTILIGGIRGGGMLTRQDEVVNLSKLCNHPILGPRPLPVGISLHGRLAVGGGATCFSFGTHWNDAVAFRFEQEDRASSGWHLESQGMVKTVEPSRETTVVDDDAWPGISQIPRMQLSETGRFERVLETGKPVIFESCSLGPCTSKWTTEYLRSAIGEERKVVVHASPEAQMDFKAKNFRYETQSFGHFMDSVEQGGLLYLRGLSKEAPSDRPTRLEEDFTEIADDFELPAELGYVVENAHSSPLRISGPVRMWLHYDVLANALCQIRGKKRLLLFPPSDVAQLGLEAGASSSSIDVLGADDTARQGLKRCHVHEALLEPGDVLFIPSLWLHAAAPTEGLSVAVNVFFRHLRSGYAAGRDVYGNRDVAAYEKGRREVSKLVKSFEDLPEEMGRFYLERLGMELMARAKTP